MRRHNLIIMRHAKSDWSAEFRSDFDRPLSRRGEKQAALMSAWLSEQGFASLGIVSSPAVRAMRTAEFVIGALKNSNPTFVYENDLYEADLDTALDIIERYGNKTDSLLIIGHNPTMDQIFSYLSNSPVRYNSKGKLFTTSAVGVLNFGESVISTNKSSAKSATLLRPKELVSSGDRHR